MILKRANYSSNSISCCGNRSAKLFNIAMGSLSPQGPPTSAARSQGLEHQTFKFQQGISTKER